MKILRTWIVVGALSVAACALAQGPKAIVAKHAAEFDRAMVTKNLAWFNSVSTPDYHEIDEKGNRIDRKQSMDQMKMAFKMMSVKSCKSTVVSAKQNGGVITSVVSSIVTGMMKMDPKAKKMSTMKSTGRYQETWKNIGGDWKISELKILSSSSTIDGKPMKGM
jgi:hypothetical protein